MRAVEQRDPEAIHWHLLEKDQRTICGYPAIGCMWENAPDLITCLECLRKLGLPFEITGDMLTDEMEVRCMLDWRDAFCQIQTKDRLATYVYMARFKPEDPVRRKLLELLAEHAPGVEYNGTDEAEQAQADALLEHFNITEK